MKSINKLVKRIKKTGSILCIGLDPQIEKMPDKFQKVKYPVFAFNKYIIDQTHDQVCAYKPNSAFYEAEGIVGITQLKMTVEYLKQKYPDIFLIDDAKRADIGSTSDAYAKSIFDYFGFDGVTLNPYLGEDSLRPFLDREDKVSIILCKTSNPGSGDFQNIKIKGKFLYEIVAEKAVSSWNKYNNTMLVVGATYPQELKKIRKIAENIFFLIPGVGSQGGDIQQVLDNGVNKKRKGIIINISRGIIYAKNPREKTLEYTNIIRNLL